jgi:hypothetical protein
MAMREIMIPFLPGFAPKIQAHIKTMTCRTKKFGEPGDTFWAFGVHCELTHVFRVRLGYVVSNAYIQEGCDSPGQLIDVWKRIHPVSGYESEKIVWAHCWKVVS